MTEALPEFIGTVLASLAVGALVGVIYLRNF